MPRPKTPLVDRVNAQSKRVGVHLIWTGPMRNNRHPFLPKFGNPVRVLLNLVDQPRISVKPTCTEPRCIDPEHWKVIREKSYKYDDAPPPQWVDPRIKPDNKFTEQEQRDIREWVELLQTGEMTTPELEEDEFLSDKVKAEIRSRI